MKPLVILDSNLSEEGSINFAVDTLAALTQKPLPEQDNRFPETVVGHHKITQNRCLEDPLLLWVRSTATTGKRIQSWASGVTVL